MAGRHAVKGNTDPFVLVENVSFEIGQLRVGRDAVGNLLQKRRPKESILDVIVERARGFDDAFEFGYALIRGGHFRFDFRPIALNRT